MTSHDLLRKWSRERDELAFRELVHRHAPMVFATSKRILRDDTEAQDVTQECFETLATTRRLPDSNLGPWLHRVATNRCLDRLRTTGRRAKREIDFATRQLQPHATDWNDIYDLVDEAIAELPDKFRTVIIAHFLEGRPQTDIANELHLTRQAIHERLNRGIEAVRAHLKRRGVQIPAFTLTAAMVQNISVAAIPSTLTSALGKLALSSHSVATGVSLFASLTTVKLFIAALGVVALSVFLVLQPSQPQNPVATEPISSAAPTTTTRSAATPSDPSLTPQRSAPPITVAQALPLPNNPPTTTPPPTITPPAEATGITVAGTVMRADGRPFERAVVALQIVMDGRPVYGTQQTAASETGAFEITGVKPGEYSVQVVPFGAESDGFFELTRIKIAVDENHHDLDLVYGKEGKFSISGSVTDTAGRPIPDMKVLTSISKKRGRVAVSDDRGRFTIEFLPEGEYEIVASALDKPESEFCDAKVKVRAGETNAKLVLERTITVEGQVIRADTSKPVQSFSLNFQRGDTYRFAEFNHWNKSPHTDPEGRFTLKGLPSGDVMITAWADGLSPRSILAHATDGATVSNLLIELTSETTIHGIVVDAQGEPIINASIYYGDIQSLGAHRLKKTAAMTNHQGEFSIANPPRDLGYLSAFRDGFAPQQLRAQSKLNFTLAPSATLTVSVSEEGVPLGNIRTLLYYPPSLPTVSTEVPRTGADGSVTIPNVLPGPLRIGIYRSENNDDKRIERYLVLNPGENHHISVDFAPATSTLEGTVTYRGLPADKVHARLILDTGHGTEQFQAINERGNFFRFENLPSGTATINTAVWSGDTIHHSISEVDLPAGMITRKEIDLRANAKIEGYLLGIDPRLQNRVEVLIGNHEVSDFMAPWLRGEKIDFLTVSSGDADADGYYFIDGLESGDYTLVALVFPRDRWANPDIYASTQVHVGENETIRADFQYK